MLTGILSFVLSLLSGPLVDKVLGSLEARANSETEREKIRTQASVETLRIMAEDLQSQRRAATEIRLATAGFWEMRLLTFLIAMPFVWHLWSVWLDTQFMFGWGINKFPPPFDEWEGAILLSFFGVSVVGSGLKAIAGGLALKKR